MRIGILTFHYVSNYGAVIQCYALCRYLKSLGNDVQVIDYRPWRQMQRIVGLRIRKKIFINPKTFFTSAFAVRPPFQAFMNLYLPLSKQTYWTSRSLRVNYPKCDAYIVGSDQVWNPYVHKNFDSAYLLDFVQDKSSRLISYAASFGGANIATDLKPVFKRNIGRFRNISVREKDGQDLIRGLIGREVEEVLDPTFLINDYSIINPSLNRKEAYIAVYSLSASDEFSNIVNFIKKRTKLPVISLGATLKEADYNKKYLNPIDWVTYIKNADYIITNSFHGTALSIIFNKQFFTHPINWQGKNRKRFNRIRNLLAKLNLECRIISDTTPLALETMLDTPVSYDRLSDDLDYKIAKSKQFILESLNS